MELPKKNEEKLTSKSSNALTLKESSIKFEDVGGMDDILKVICTTFFHLKAGKLYQKLKVSPVRGLVLHGPSGCGKSHLVHAIAGQFQIPLIEVAATELVCGVSGESERKIRDTFDEAVNTGRCILFIDQIDALTSKRENAIGAMEKRIVSQLLKCFDELNEKDVSHNVTVIAATNLPDSIDPVLRREGRFERDLPIGIPNEESRLKILKVLCKELTLEPGFNLSLLAHQTPGFVGADLKALIVKALEIGLCRMQEEMIREFSTESKMDIKEENCTMNDFSVAEIREWFRSYKVNEKELEKQIIKLEDFQAALRSFIPFCKREGLCLSDVTWEDIGALEKLKEQLQATILEPLKCAKFYEESKLSCTKGILLYGPKGCGKTLLAKAIANECGINFFCINGPELFNMYSGESEKSIKRCFLKARNSAPCILFFDEFDLVCPSRSNVNLDSDKVVSQFLIEMDGIQECKEVFVIAATSRLERIDSAMLRPGRLEKLLYVDLPTPAGRTDILRSQTKNKTHPRIAEDLSLKTLAYDERCNDFSGADLAYLVREATTKAIAELMNSPLSGTNLILKKRHFDQAFEVVKPSLCEEEIAYYKNNQGRS